MKKNILKVSSFLMILFLIFTLIGCDKPVEKTYYNIAFETNGGSAIQNVKFAEGEKAVKPSAPIKENCTFIGWFIDEEFGEEFDFDVVPENKDYTLYAKWNVSIFFETNGGNELNAYTADAKDMVILPIATDDEGQQFIGWYYDEELTNKVEALFTVPNDSITLYAKWANIETGTTIDFLSTLVVNEENHYTIEKDNEGVTVTPTESKTAWSFIYSPINVSLSGYTILHIKFSGTEGAQMTVKLEGGNVSAIEQIFTFTGEVQDEYWIIPEENIAVEEGQRILIFVDGSKAGNDYETSVLINNLEFCRLKETGEEIDQALIFNSNGGSTVESVIGKYNSVIVMPENPTKAGFVFDGWYLDEELTQLFIASTMPMGPTYLYAKWVDAPAHTVSFETNCELTVESIEVKEGLSIPVSTLEKQGWEFVGWYRNEELSDTNLVMGEEDVTLYAKWKTLKDLSDLENPYSLMTNWVVNEADTYSVAESEDKLEITATTTKGKWSYIYREISEYDLKYANALHLEFEGEIGRSFIVKYNNKVEKKITITEEHQEEWLYLSTAVDPSIKIIVFYAPNQTLEENETITFTKFEILDPSEKYDYIDVKGTLLSPETSAYEITTNTNDVTVTATTAKGTWSFVRIDLSTVETVESDYAKALCLELVGPAEHTLIIKYNDNKEQKVTLTGETQKIEIEFAAKLDLSMTNHLVIFVDGGKKLEENIDIVFTKIQIKSLVHEIIDSGEIVYTYESVDITKSWTSPDASAYEITETDNGFTVVATTSKGTYSTLKYVFTEVYTDAYSVKVTVTGPAGKYLLIKYNNSKEVKFELTGETQELEVVFAVSLDMSKPLYMFVEPGKTLEENVELQFSKVELVRQIAEGVEEPVYEEVSLLEGWFSADAGAYEVSNENDVLSITGTTTKGSWSVAKLLINELGIENTVSFKIKVTGPTDHSMIFKVNNKVETKITFTGELQEVEMTLTVDLDTSIALYIFIDGGKTLTENITIEITELSAVVEK